MSTRETARLTFGNSQTPCYLPKSCNPINWTKYDRFLPRNLRLRDQATLWTNTCPGFWFGAAILQFVSRSLKHRVSLHHSTNPWLAACRSGCRAMIWSQYRWAKSSDCLSAQRSSKMWEPMRQYARYSTGRISATIGHNGLSPGPPSDRCWHWRIWNLPEEGLPVTSKVGRVSCRQPSSPSG
jgi:hypothetical protein